LVLTALFCDVDSFNLLAVTVFEFKFFSLLGEAEERLDYLQFRWLALIEVFLSYTGTTASFFLI